MFVHIKGYIFLFWNRGRVVVMIALSSFRFDGFIFLFRWVLWAVWLPEAWHESGKKKQERGQNEEVWWKRKNKWGFVWTFINSFLSLNQLYLCSCWLFFRRLPESNQRVRHQQEHAQQRQLQRVFRCACNPCSHELRACFSLMRFCDAPWQSSVCFLPYPFVVLVDAEKHHGEVSDKSKLSKK